MLFSTGGEKSERDKADKPVTKKQQDQVTSYRHTRQLLLSGSSGSTALCVSDLKPSVLASK